MLGILLTKWTIRLALACYAGYLTGLLVNRSPGWSIVGRWLSTAGCGLFIVHVVCAMAFYHDWSHEQAFTTTARETQELLGFEFGAGIYFSYLFMLVWIGDVLWSWVAPASFSARPRWLMLGLHLYLVFIAFNGAIVFEAGPTRWAGIAVCIALSGLVLWRVARTVGRPSVGLPGYSRDGLAPESRPTLSGQQET